jgi:carboxymethylenebutenolidase
MLQRISARDGHTMDAWIVRPSAKPRGGLVVAQEMYGITDYIKEVCAYWAGHGYLTIAPALFDRRGRGQVFAYDDAGQAAGRAVSVSCDWDEALDDLDAARAAVNEAGKVGLVGFCWGGTLAWLAACRRQYDGIVSYYGSNMPDFADEQPHCPIIANIGEKDATVPAPLVAKFKAAQPNVPVHLYPEAQHGFDNALRPARYHAKACRDARATTLAFLRERIG